MNVAALKSAAEETAADLRAGGIIGRVRTNGHDVMYHLDHQILDDPKLGQRGVEKLAWAAMTGLTAKGIAWATEDIDLAHSILAVGGALVLAFDTED